MLALPVTAGRLDAKQTLEIRTLQTGCGVGVNAYMIGSLR